MDFANKIGEALLSYALFIPLLTFHEWAHAWTAWKLGDDTAYQRGRVSLNPIVHMELLGTVILPLLGVLSGAMGAGIGILGWGKPVPVNPNNLKNPRSYDSLIAMAGPAMNVLLAVILMAVVKVASLMHLPWLVEISFRTAMISLLLCFFNLLPVPPLDGSHLWMNAVKMSPETYYRLARYGFFALIILIQFQPVWNVIMGLVIGTMGLLMRLFGVSVE